MAQWIETPALQQPLRTAQPMDFADNWVNATHIQALFAYGELAIFTLMWRPRDFERGLVGRCETCFEGAKSRQAAAFKQATDRNCPDCYGTTFEGGFRAQIIRPVIMSDRNVETTDEARGAVVSDSILLETTGDFTLHKGDYLFRADGTRFQTEEGKETVVRTGFQLPLSEQSASLSTTARMDEETSAAYIIPPLDAGLLRMVLGRKDYYLGILDLSALETIRPNGYIKAGTPVVPTTTAPRLVGPNMWSGYGPPPTDPFGAASGDLYLDLWSGQTYTLA